MRHYSFTPGLPERTAAFRPALAASSIPTLAWPWSVRAISGHSPAELHPKRAEIGAPEGDLRGVREVERPAYDVRAAVDDRHDERPRSIGERQERAARQAEVRDPEDLGRIRLAAGGLVPVEPGSVPGRK